MVGIGGGTQTTEVLGVAFWKSWLNYIDVAVSIISVAPWRRMVVVSGWEGGFSYLGLVVVGKAAFWQFLEGGFGFYICALCVVVSYEGRNSQRLANHESFQVRIYFESRSSHLYV